MLALQCGGSDGYSGITANPALGVAADILVRHGGTAILSRDAGDLWRRASADAARARRREVGEKLVDIIHWWEDYTEPQQDGDEQQPVARQQARRADHHPREVAGRGGQGRHDAAQRGLSLCRAGDREGLRVHGYAGLRPGVGDGAGGGRRQHPVLHHRPRLGLWLQADAVDQARHQLRHLPAR